MKRVIMMTLLCGSMAAGIIYGIHLLQKKNSLTLRLDFAENALGG
jgi:hypothetical protein